MRTGMLLVALAVIMTGCSPSADSLVKDQIQVMNDMAEALETNADKGKLDAIKKRMEDLGSKMKDMKISDDEKKRLAEKYKDEMSKAMQRLVKASLGKSLGDVGGKLPFSP